MKPAVYIGQMDRKISIFQETKTQNSTGEEKKTAVLIAQPFAFMEEHKGDEDVEGKVRQLIDRKYFIRYNQTIATNGNKYILQDGANVYRIYHLMEVGRKQHLQLLVTKYE